MKIKKLSLGLMVLAFVALTSVGFAAWVITGDAEASDNGQIQVEQAIDARIQMTAEIKNDEVIIFGTGEAGTLDPSKIWLTNTDVPAEKLSVTLVLTITNWDTVNANIDWFEGSVSVASAAYDAAKVYTINEGDPEKEQSFNLLGELPSESFDKDDFVAGNGVYEIPLTFTWGDAFKVDSANLNPYTYYNDGTKTSADYGDEALARLNHIYNYLKPDGEDNKATYTVTVTAAPAEDPDAQ